MSEVESSDQRTPLLAPSDDNRRSNVAVGSANGQSSGRPPPDRRDGQSAASRHTVWWMRLIEVARPGVTEMVATALFVFIGTMSVATGNSLQIALAHGLTITLLIAAVSDISGAHMNPAVTLAVYIATNAIRWSQAVAYVLLQLIGGIAGAALTRGVLSYRPAESTFNVTVYQSIRGGSHTLANGLTAGEGILLETVMTFILIQTILLIDTDRTWRRRQLAFAVGFAVFVDIAVSANITGGSMNPARSFGPAVVVSDLDTGVWTHHYVYWVGPLIGSLTAVAFFRLIFGGTERKALAEQQLEHSCQTRRSLLAV